MHLIDNETKVDLLNNEPIAATVVKLLRGSAGTAVTVGLHGDWGAGKSSLLAMIESAFSGEKDIACLRFNGWIFQGFEDAKVVLLEGIVAELVRSRTLTAKGKELGRNLLKRIDWLKLAKRAGSLAFTAHTGIPTPDLIGDITGGIGALLDHPGEVVSKESLKAALDGTKDALKDTAPKHVPEEIHAFRHEFDSLLSETGIRQLIILIDDLDRCLPKPAIETLEAIRLFLFTSRTAFVIAADEAMIEYAVREHFPDLPAAAGPLTYARNYLEKLIQVPFRIPALGGPETRIYTTLLLIQSEVGEADPAFVKLLATARELLKRPWRNPELDRTTVETAMGGHLAAGVQAAITLSQQISPILADGSKGNPRQIKRFLNSLLLRYAIAEARGFAEDITRPALAKIMLAERFMPRVFDRLARMGANAEFGKVSALAAIEEIARAPETPTPRKRASRAAAPRKQTQRRANGIDSATAELVAAWRSDQALMAWARIDPPLGEIDLRPYLFVTRDRRIYFSGGSAESRLEPWIDRLMGARMAVAALETELRGLPDGDLDQLFDALRDRILQAEDKMVAPAGIPGLSLLAKVHQPGQRRLVEMLEDLPLDGLGPWVVAGWSDVITDGAAQARFSALLDRWATQEQSPALSTVAKQIRSLPARKGAQ
ncbi:MAG: NTPase KAP [Alphaproteobacteria bacterium]|nr:NTPase KAP [Alphaproteobacteria bacterium]